MTSGMATKNLRVAGALLWISTVKLVLESSDRDSSSSGFHPGMADTSLLIPFPVLDFAGDSY